MSKKNTELVVREDRVFNLAIPKNDVAEGANFQVSAEDVGKAAETLYTAQINKNIRAAAAALKISEEAYKASKKVYDEARSKCGPPSSFETKVAKVREALLSFYPSAAVSKWFKNTEAGKKKRNGKHFVTEVVIYSDDDDRRMQVTAYIYDADENEVIVELDEDVEFPKELMAFAKAVDQAQANLDAARNRLRELREYLDQASNIGDVTRSKLVFGNLDKSGERGKEVKRMVGEFVQSQIAELGLDLAISE